MGSSSKSIELVIKVLDQASKNIGEIADQFGVAEKAADSFKEILAGLAVGFTLDKLVDSITEAQTATNNLNRQFEQFGATVGISKENMIDFAETTAKSTTLTSESLRNAQATLLNYTSITGKAFTDARSLVVDLAAKMGGDAAQAAELLGRALQNPVSGIRLLAQVGVTLTQSQRATISSLQETGDSAQAVNFILDSLRQRVTGAAADLTNTLGGALKQIKNSFDDAFTGQGADVSGLVQGLHDLNDIVASPDFQEGIRNMVSGIVDIAKVAASGVQDVLDFGKAIGEAFAHQVNGADTPVGVLQDQARALNEVISSGGENGLDVSGYITQLQKVEAEIAKLQKSAEDAKPAVQNFVNFGVTGDSFDSARPKAPTPLFDPLQFPINTGRAHQVNAGDLTDQNPFMASSLVQQYETDTENSLDKAEDTLRKKLLEIQALFSSGFLTATDASGRSALAQQDYQTTYDKIFAPIEVTAKKIQVPLNEIEKEGEQVAQSLSGAFENFFESGNYSARNFAATMLKAFDQIFAKAASQDIVDLLGIRALFSNSAASTQSGGLLGAIGALFTGTKSGDSAGYLASTGYSAGGGDLFGAKVVGENGPELFVPGMSGKVLNRSQLSFGGGGGGGINYAPVHNISVVSDDSSKTTADLAKYLTYQSKQDISELKRQLQRNGIKLR